MNISDSGLGTGVGVGDSVEVQTHDGHRFLGQVLELRSDDHGRELAVLRLETGWQVSYPVTMVRRHDTRADSTTEI